MFIETLEFTIPVDLCDLFSSLKEGPRSNMEFPASVNSYGTTQDASIQVALRANKLTFVVEGVSSNASMISKSECKTLRLSVFDVDRTLIAQECVSTQSMMMEPPSPLNLPSKRQRDFPVSQPPRAKSTRTSYSESSPSRSPAQNNTHTQIRPRPSNHSESKAQSDNVNVKQEPEDPDLIEIEPDPEPDDIVPKKETPYMQIDYSSEIPHTQTSQAALERVSFPSTSRSQLSSSFHQNVPHVQDFNQPGPSQGDQGADDFLVFQDDNDYGDNDNSADYSNDDVHGYGSSVRSYWGRSGNPQGLNRHPQTKNHSFHTTDNSHLQTYSNDMAPNLQVPRFPCGQCGRSFASAGARHNHVQTVHDKIKFTCVCGKVYAYQQGLIHHRKTCASSMLNSSR